MTDSIRNLEPRVVWEHFDEILKIPRASGKEEKIRKWLAGWAKDKNFSHVVDAAGNLVIYIPATVGYENSLIIVLQGHMDMVCEKNEDTKFDFDKDAIKVFAEGEWLKTRGTSMGADNGIGIAAALATAVDQDAVHGPLELLFTVDEETGLTGAFNLDASLIRGRILLNLDSEDEGTFYVGCAGGGDGVIHFPLTRGKPAGGGKGLKVKLTGMKGGHSGLNINENRANAVKAAARMLRHARENGIKFNLIAIDGGDEHNAIPRECTFEVAVNNNQLDEFRTLLETWRSEIFFSEFKKTDPGMKVQFTPLKRLPAKVLTNGCRDKLIALLMGLPHGVIAMSRDIAGLVETSSNLASVACRKKDAVIVTSSRSSVASALDHVRDGIAEIAKIAGAIIDQKQGYPGWQPNMDSKVLAKSKEVYLHTFGKEPQVAAIHAGLECGILGEKCAGMDMISFGPTLSSVHSPDEKMHIGSVKNFYNFLKIFLKALA
ncbi:MAG: aminoacyl-histidine dipeptidase [Pseudomonadota bacterium]